MGLGERLKELRGEQSVAEFCRQFGIHRNTLPRYEDGKRTPDADFIAALCKHYNVNPAWLLLGEGLMRKDIAPSGQQTECTDPRCVGALHTHGHIMAKVPQFDAELLAHIFKELHDYKASNPDTLSEKQALDIISLASVFLQPENKVEAELICSIVKKWFDTGKKQ